MVCRRERKKNTHLSPRKSMTYAVTPPGILTSTRTSTRENALKQLHHGGTNGSTKPIRAGGGGRVQAISIIVRVAGWQKRTKSSHVSLSTLGLL
jgi:hypothetical protein